MKSSIVLFVLSFAVFGLLLGIASVYDAPVSESIKSIDTERQAKLFEECKNQASADGNLTDEEYFSCAYSIYD